MNHLCKTLQNTAQKMKFSIKDFFSKRDQICSFLRISSRLLKKSLIKNFIFCAVKAEQSYTVRRTSETEKNCCYCIRSIIKVWIIYKMTQKIARVPGSNTGLLVSCGFLGIKASCMSCN